jgi:hypothetical protein
MMKSRQSLAGGCSRAKRLVCPLIVIVALVMTVVGSGCGPWASPGETGAEANRRRERTLRVNNSEMWSDIDDFLMLDEPSRLTERDLP